MASDRGNDSPIRWRDKYPHRNFGAMADWGNRRLPDSLPWSSEDGHQPGDYGEEQVPVTCIRPPDHLQRYRLQPGDSETITRIWGKDAVAAVLGGRVPPADALLSEGRGGREWLFDAGQPLPWSDTWFGRLQFRPPTDANRIPLARSIDNYVWPGYLAAMVGASLVNPGIRDMVEHRSDGLAEGYLFETQTATWNQIALPTGARTGFSFRPFYPADREGTPLAVDTGGEEFGPALLRMLASRWRALSSKAEHALEAETLSYQKSVKLVSRYARSSAVPPQRGYPGLSVWQSIPRIATEAASMSGIPWCAASTSLFPETKGSFARTAVSLVQEGIPLIFIDNAAYPHVAISTTESGQIGCYNPVGSLWANYDAAQLNKTMSPFVVAPVLGWEKFTEPQEFKRAQSENVVMKTLLPLAIRAIGGYGGAINRMVGR